jgi:hypothetical protein
LAKATKKNRNPFNRTQIMSKKKTSQEMLAEGIEMMHPVYAAYLRQRLEADTQKLIEMIPKIYEKDKQDMEQGRISMFSPDFYVTYVNSLLEIFDRIEGTKTPRVPYGGEQETSVVTTPQESTN